jgi:hypothetical protein
MKTYLVIGECGSGKTWVMMEAIKHFGLTEREKLLKINFNRGAKTLVLGNYDGTTFQGSDRLSMAVAQDFEPFKQWAEMNGIETIICEGDRFTNKRFIDIYSPTIIRILDDGSRGREFRGTSQSERQLKSIKTRVENTPVDFKFKTSSEVLEWLKKEIKQ